MPLTNSDGFESHHSPLKAARQNKRCSINVLFTVIKQDERRSTYYSTGNIIPSDIEKFVTKICRDEKVLSFIDSSMAEGEILYECSRLSMFGTAYKLNQYVILPQSKNEILLLGKITKLLCNTNYGYLLCQNMSTEYCQKSDLFFLKDTDQFEVVPLHWLSDPRPLQVEKLNQS